MGLIREQPIEPADLKRRLQNHRDVADAQASAPIDVVALLMALARVESRWDVAARGDNGRAVGLWQIHSAFHDYDADRMDADVDYQISIAVEVYRQVERVVLEAHGTVRRRRQQGQSLRFSAGRDVPQWFNILWQFSDADFLQWVKSSSDLTTDGWKSFKSSIGEPIPITWNWDNPVFPRGRIQRFAAEYREHASDPPSFTEEVLVGTAEDIAGAGQAAADAAGEAIDKGKEFVGDAGGIGQALDQLADDVLGSFKTFFYISAALGALILIAVILFLTTAERQLVAGAVAGGAGGQQ